MKLKIRAKIVITSTVLYSALLIILALLAVYDTFTGIVDVYDSKLMNHLILVRTDIEDKYALAERVDIKQIEFLPYKGNEFFAIEIYDKDNQLVSKPHPEILREEIDDFFNSEWRDQIYGDDETREHFYVNTLDVKISGANYQLMGVIAAREIDVVYTTHKFFIILATPIVVILITFVSMFISKRAFLPVRRMVKDVKKIRATDLHERIRIPEPNDEIKELAETLNGMLASIEDSFISQKRFIADASHEIRTPITVIRSNIELMLDKTENEECRKSIRELLPELDRLSDLAQSLLMLAKYDNEANTGKTELVRIDETIIEVTKKITACASEKNVKLIPMIREPLETFAVSDEIFRMLYNLVDNAVKYSYKNGKVEIELKRIGKSACLTIADKGVGISEKDLPKIFNRFYRSDETRADYTGNGLGLSIVEEIVKKYKGNIKVYSHPGAGTKVLIWLPAAT